MAKILEIIARPNGSGKTTFAETALVKKENSLFLNSDKIAAELTLNGNEFAQFETGRFMLEKIENCMKNNFSFSFETTMPGRIWVSYIKKAKTQGYKTNEEKSKIPSN